jgi:sec-independent protein translocase protein TatA
MGLFDSPSHVIIVLVVLVLLFGSAKLPKLAKSLGESMRIFKGEAQKLHNDDQPQATQAQPFVQAELPPAPPPAASQQVPGAAPQATAPQAAAPQAAAPQAAAPPAGAPQTQHTNQNG